MTNETKKSRVGRPATKNPPETLKVRQEKLLNAHKELVKDGFRAVGFAEMAELSGESTEDLRAALKNLLISGDLVVRGEKRGAKYYSSLDPNIPAFVEKKSKKEEEEVSEPSANDDLDAEQVA